MQLVNSNDRKGLVDLREVRATLLWLFCFRAVRFRQHKGGVYARYQSNRRVF
jgi:hypothetical protein